MARTHKKAAVRFVECLENEGVEYIFGLPGEENIDVMDALLSSKIRFVLTRHEQAAAFMADIYGRLTSKAGVCLATLGPGAINLIQGSADAYLDSVPFISILGQASLDRQCKESHQVLDLVELFNPVSKWAVQIPLADSVPEVVRKAFKVAQTDRFGPVAVVLPEDIAQTKTKQMPLMINQHALTEPNPHQLERAVKLINEAKRVVILAGNGVCRHHVSGALREFVEKTGIPVATTFTAKGTFSDQEPLSLGAIGFMVHDYANVAFDHADLVITVGYDLVEYGPVGWNAKNDKKIIHIHTIPAEVDAHYQLSVGIQGQMPVILKRLMHDITPRTDQGKKSDAAQVRKQLNQELSVHDEKPDFPMKPQRVVSELRRALGANDIVVCDTGALKMWMARLYPCYQPNTCLFSNGLSTMGIAVPGALGAKLVHPDRHVVAVTGDGSFLMNSQELETATREGLNIIVLIWRDGRYGLIEWKQKLNFGRTSHIDFTNPDFVKYAESFGVQGFRVEAADELLPILKEAMVCDGPVVIDCPVDYSENIKLTDRLGILAK